MTLRGFIACGLFLAATCMPVGAADLDAVRAEFVKAFPKVTVDSVGVSDIAGWYEIETQGRIVYFNPELKRIFVGDIITSDGKNLTDERLRRLAAEKARKLPLEKAVKIGGGRNVIIEFTDPDCPYCRKASAFLKDVKDVTRYIFFFPLPMHPKAADKAAYVLSSKDMAAAYEKVMSGGLDGDVPKPSDDAKRRVDEHKTLGASVGVEGTPMFFVNDVLVSGADTKRIESLLK